MEGPVTLASDLASVKSFMKWSIKKPILLHQVLDFATDATITYANSMVAAGADVISIADPVASPDLMSPDSFGTSYQGCRSFLKCKFGYGSAYLWGCDADP